MTESEKGLLIQAYGTAYFDSPIVVDFQNFKHDLVFVWNEQGDKLEKIEIINIDDNLMIDINKKYRVCLEEIEIVEI
jgi:hypothetical protein